MLQNNTACPLVLASWHFRRLHLLNLAWNKHAGKLKHTGKICLHSCNIFWHGLSVVHTPAAWSTFAPGEANPGSTVQQDGRVWVGHPKKNPSTAGGSGNPARTHEGSTTCPECQRCCAGRGPSQAAASTSSAPYKAQRGFHTEIRPREPLTRGQRRRRARAPSRPAPTCLSSLVK